jgi:uncharacterized protein (TIGR03000 family)
MYHKAMNLCGILILAGTAFFWTTASGQAAGRGGGHGGFAGRGRFGGHGGFGGAPIGHFHGVGRAWYGFGRGWLNRGWFFGSYYPGLYGYGGYPYYGYYGSSYGPTYDTFSSGANYSNQPGYAMGQMPGDNGDENAVRMELPHRTGEVRSAPPDAAVIKIDLPDDSALVRINGQAVTSAGKTRYFVTPELNKGKEYSYAIKVQWTKNGEQVTEERKITVEAGKIAKVNFTTTVAAH